MSGRIDQLESRVFLSIIHVDVSSPATTPDGATWATAYQDLQQALSGAGAGDQIWIADGTYKPTSGNDRFAWFRLKDRVSMFGGYAGYGAADPDRRDALVFTTTLSGDIGSLGDNTDNSYHVVIGNNISAATTLDGLTIRWGNANGPDDGQTTFEDRGPAVFLNASSPLITNCTVTNHTAEFLGGISIDGGAPRLTYCRFANNGPVGVNAANGGGGGISAYEAIVSIEHCEFINNTMVQRGGGVMMVYSTGHISDCFFTRNSANGGGGIAVGDVLTTSGDSSMVDIRNCAFNGNQGSAGGAVHARSGCTATMVNCTAVGNRTTFRAGALYSSFAATNLSAINCVIVDNESVAASGIYNNGATTSVVNGVIWNNVGAPEQVSGSVSVTNSDVDGGFAGTGNINADPQFVRNPSPGADNTWGTSDDDYGDLRFQITSPCVDSGSDAAVPPDVTTDLAGNPRFCDFPGANDPGAIVDMGAYELNNRLGLFHVASNQTLALPAGHHTFVIEQLAIDNGGTLDIRDNDLVIDYSGASQLEALIRSARSGGSWTGTGITSTSAKNHPLHNTTLGAIEATDFKSVYGQNATFNGEAIDATAVLVKYSYYGDTDFNGRVNFDDYVRADNGFNNHLSGWMNGNFDGNGDINFDDYVLIDLAFNTQGAPLGRSGIRAR